MTNKDITNLMYANNEVDALYMGVNLVWQRANDEVPDPDNYIPKYNFSGKFSDDSTEEDWWYYKNGSTSSSNKVSIADKVDPITKIFDLEFDLEKNLKSNKITLQNLFYKNDKIEKIYSIPTKGATSMYAMFRDCTSLQSLDTSGWNTENVTSMYAMFYGCTSLQSLDTSGWNTENVTTMEHMFYDCTSLKSLDTSGWNTENVTSVFQLFSDSENRIINIKFDCSNWDLSSCKDFRFFNLRNNGINEIDLSKTNNNVVEYIDGIVLRCENVKKVKLGKWDLINVNEISSRLSDNPNLTSIEGEIKNIRFSIILSGCPLTNESAMVFINGLAIVEEPKSIKFSPTTYDTLTQDQIATATSKGWTVVRDTY